MHLKASRLAYKVALIYIIVAGGWVVFSGELVKAFVSDPDEQVHFSILKGLGLVILTGVLLHLGLRRILRGWEQEVARRQQAEAARHESEERYRQLFMVATDAVFLVDLQGGQIVEANPMAEKMYGYNADEFNRLKVIDISAEPEQTRQALADGTKIIPLRWHRRKDGTVFPVEICCSDIFYQNRKIHVAVIRDITERKQMEAEIQRMSRWLLDTQRISKVGGWTFNLKTGAVWVSPEAVRIYGAGARQEYTISLMQSFPLPQFRPQLDAALNDLIAGRRPYDEEFQIKRGTDGASVDIHTVAEYNADEAMIQGVIEDITERKQAERIMQRQAAFASHNPNPVLELSATGKVVYFNAAALAMANALGRRLPAEILPANTAGIVRNCLATARPLLRLETPVGDRVISWSFFPVAGNQVVHGYAGDITERKQAETALRESESLLRSIMENTKDVVFVKDLECRFVFMNAAGYRLTGMTPALLLGHSKADFHPNPVEAAQFMVEDRRVMESGQTETIEEEFGTADGTRHIFLTTKVARRDSEGKVIGLIGVAHDITERKRAETALRESQALYHTLVMQLPIGIFQKNPQGQYVLVNPEFCRLKGMKVEDFLGKTPVEVAASEAAKRGLSAAKYYMEGADHHQQIMQTGKSVELDEEYLFDEKREHFLHVIKLPVLGTDGKIIGTQGIQFDITERKLAERSLKLFRTLIERSSDGIHVVDPATGRFLDVNESACRALGYTREELLALTVFDVAITADPSVFIGPKKPGHVMLEVLHRRKDGTIYPVEVSLSSVTLDREYLVTIVRDITERKQAEETHARLVTAVEQAAESILITDTRGTILYVNPALEKISGYTKAEVLGRNPNLLKSGKHDAAFYQRIWAVLEVGETWSGHFINRHKDGSLYEEEATISPVRDAAGKIVNYVAVKRDVTREVQLEAQFRQSQKMEAVGQLAGGVAHDFNNILAVIQLQAGLLMAEPGLTDHQQDSARDIEKAAQRAANLIRQLLLFSRKQALRLCDLDLNEAVPGIAKMLQRVLGEQVQMQFKFAPHPLLVHADTSMVDQVLMNLAVNARDAMPKGGQLIIETAAVEFDVSQAIHTSQARPGSFVCVSVSDTGCGIPPEILPRIFEPFFTTKDVGKGSGLGLATVFGIVQQHQGWINVYSEVGRGTTFRVYLPRRLKPSENKPVRTALGDICGGSETILLVEDDAALRANVRSVLGRLGYRVLEASHGKAALEVWQQHRDEIRLLLTDMVMPGGMTGLDLAGQLLQQNPKLKVVYSSGYSADIASDEIHLEEGVNFLTKPFEVPKLAQIIRQCLDKN